MRLRVIAPATAALVSGALLVAGCGSSGDAASGTASTTGHGDHAANADYLGGKIEPVQTAPALRLKDIDGKTIDIRSFKGHPTLVTFVYAHCPDVCPLIMTNLRQVRRISPLGSKLRVIAVSVDPKGDTPAVVRSFLERQGVASFVHYAIGTRPQLERVWKAWGVAERVPKSNPELVEHSAFIFGVTASGKRATLYPAVGFKPADIAKDVPLLAES